MPFVRRPGQVRCLLGLAAAGWLAAPRPARADAATYLFVGPGAAMREDRAGSARGPFPALALDLGMGSSPAGLLSVGGLAGLRTRFGDGSDFALSVRTATRGYVRADFGAALDLGGYVGQGSAGAPGLTATLSLGAPYAITANLVGSAGQDGARGLAIVVGLDLARFTVHRSTGLGWWVNPLPARDR